MSSHFGNFLGPNPQYLRIAFAGDIDTSVNRSAPSPDAELARVQRAKTMREKIIYTIAQRGQPIILSEFIGADVIRLVVAIEHTDAWGNTAELERNLTSLGLHSVAVSSPKFDELLVPYDTPPVGFSYAVAQNGDRYVDTNGAYLVIPS